MRRVVAWPWVAFAAVAVVGAAWQLVIEALLWAGGGRGYLHAWDRFQIGVGWWYVAFLCGALAVALAFHARRTGASGRLLAWIGASLAGSIALLTAGWALWALPPPVVDVRFAGRLFELVWPLLGMTVVALGVNTWASSRAAACGLVLVGVGLLPLDQATHLWHVAGLLVTVGGIMAALGATSPAPAPPVPAAWRVAYGFVGATAGIFAAALASEMAFGESLYPLEFLQVAHDTFIFFHADHVLRTSALLAAGAAGAALLQRFLVAWHVRGSHGSETAQP
jgi:hypothetical protein